MPECEGRENASVKGRRTRKKSLGTILSDLRRDLDRWGARRGNTKRNQLGGGKQQPTVAKRGPKARSKKYDRGLLTS